jgi:DNA polymerase I-like protein with 3'-5' exonuclease and polymerase domains
MTHQHNGTTSLDAARGYLRDGVKVIPIPFQSKRCLLDGWPDLDLTEADLPRHFPAGTKTNVGLLTGVKGGGLIDVDLDCVQAIAAAGHLLPGTTWVSGRASNPKSHRWYICDDPPPYEQFLDVDGTTMLAELQSTGRQTVVPPSTHPTGEQYIWHTKVAEPPRLVGADLQRATRQVAAAALIARHWPTEGRHFASLALAGGLLRAEWSQEQVEVFVRAVADAANDEETRQRVRNVLSTAQRKDGGKNTIGWPRFAELLGRDGDRVVRRVREWLGIRNHDPQSTPGMGGEDAGKDDVEPWGKSIPLSESRDVSPFPVDVYPPAVRAFAEAVAKSMNCPVDYAAVPIIGTAGAAIGGARQLQIKPGYTALPNTYTAVVGPPGSAKSPAQKTVTDSYHAIDAELGRESSRTLKEHRARLDDYKDEVKEWKKGDKAGPRPEEPEAPLELRAVVGDITAERLKGLLAMNPKGLLRENDELTGLVMSMNAYKSGKGTDRQLYLTAWTGRLETTDRVRDKDEGKGGTRNHVTCLSVLGGLTPDNLFLFKGEVRKGRPIEDGFFDRFLFSFPDAPDDAPENWESVAQANADAWAGVVKRLRQLEPVLDTYPDGTAVNKPVVLKLTDCGRTAWQQFTVSHAGEKNSAEFPAHLKGIWSKLKGYCPRIALIIHYLRHVAGEVADERAGVDAESIRRAVRLVAYFKSHARKVATAIDLDPRVSDAKVVLSWLHKYVRFIAAEKKKPADRFQVRDAFEYTKGVLETMDRLNAALDILEQHGQIRPLARPSRSGPGRSPSPWYLINPELKTGSHNSQNYPPDDDDGTEPGPDPNSANCASHFGSDGHRSCGGGRRSPGSAPGNSANCATRCEAPNSHADCDRARPDDNSANCAKQSENGIEPDVGSEASHGYVLVTNSDGLDAIRAGLDDAQGERVYLDTETTGLDPLTDRVRLLSTSVPAGEARVIYLVDCFQVDPAPLGEALAGCEVVGHNLIFDLQFLAPHGFRAGRTADTMLLAALDVAGTGEKVNLAACVKRYLGRDISKEEQTSDWSGPLSQAQLNYAAEDVRILADLDRELARTIRTIGSEHVAEIECRAVPAVAWMAETGIAFDGPAWTERAAASDRAKAEAVAELDRLAPERTGQIFTDTWEWSKTAHIAEALKLLGHPVPDTRNGTLAGIDHPFAAAVRAFRAIEKQVSSYGNDWLKHVRPGGRIHAQWHQLCAASGRMACSEPNLQQVPRDDSRKCFVAGPGNVLVKADYSQIELRIAARITEDGALLAAYRRGDDLHTLTAKAVLGAKEVTKADRQLAKAVNFGLLFGMGAKGFRSYAKAQYGVDLSDDEAQRYRAAFFRAYPGLRAWHERTRQSVERLFKADPEGVHEVRTLAGRRRVLKVGKKGTDGAYPNVTEALNTPVQGTGADGLKLALALLWERRTQCPTAAPVLAVHDEIVLEVPEPDAGPAAEWLKRCMVEAVAPLIDPVPVEVETRVARTWGGD